MIREIKGKQSRGACWRILLPAIAAIAALFSAACSLGLSVPGEKQEPTETDVAIIGPGSLQVEVTSYSWEFWNTNTHIKVFGEVVNNTGKPLQGVTLTGTLHDSRGKPIARGDCYVTPTYLPDGGPGSFEFVGLTKRSSKIGATTLVTVVRTMMSF